ncbi:MAG: hypothetical protein A3D64_02825 [Candidatus Wildermuthbacteria bacterium RIFCSPHIGHO2_02_FULL_49_9]|uniref:Prepilin-type N-terminal cleavage/methylation domain-containing protein n=1 Tax=Candidatus Wildermuthbacteria bacterium RIFCSPHIGHO2_02_FULL_49_9 TaxID=1802456 RepID=A0A1G2RFA6_9BACT|nr:MAG: hypothetical protein A3D64_02825 [Candidatus Wildermuthbacteria bacterium RIFCSPHIGHO2_02_FULL_49_9]
MKKGFTLIETIIYIALLAFLLGAGISAAFYIIDSSQKNKSEVNVQAEGNFILRKLDWALTGATDVSAAGTTLTVTKAGGPYVFSYDGSKYFRLGAVNLNSSLVTVSDVVFSVSGAPKKVTADFTVNGKAFNLTKYLRK